MSMLSRKILSFAVLLLLPIGLLVSGPAKISAADNGSVEISVTPVTNSKFNKSNISSWFKFESPVGGQTTDRFIVQNKSSRKYKIKLYPADAVATAQGDFSVKLRTEEQKQIGKWISLDASELELEPLQKFEVGFKLKAPDNVAPGDYAGGIIAEVDSGALPNNDGFNINVVKRFGARVYLNVEGAKSYELKIADVKQEVANGKIQYRVSLQNDSNIIANPKLNLKLKQLGSAEATYTLSDISQILPGDARDVVVETGIDDPTFDYHALTVQVDYNDGHSVSGSYGFWLVGVKFLVALLILSALLLSALVLLSRQGKLKLNLSLRRKPQPSKEIAVESDRDDKLTANIKFFGTLITILLALMIIAIIYLAFSARPIMQPAAKEEDRQLATPTENGLALGQAKINWGNFKITVLNGSGVRGSAGNIEALLKNESIVVTKLGNAENYSYVGVTIKGHPASQDTLEELAKVFEKFSLSTTLTLDSQLAEDEIVVVVGK
jgi:hypothetical protein